MRCTLTPYHLDAPWIRWREKGARVRAQLCQAMPVSSPASQLSTMVQVLYAGNGRTPRPCRNRSPVLPVRAGGLQYVVLRIAAHETPERLRRTPDTEFH